MRSPHAYLITALCSLAVAGCGHKKYKPDPAPVPPKTEQNQELANFTKYCQNPESDAVAQTVLAIKELAATEECGPAQTFLAGQESLDLEGKTLGDLRPLAKLDGLKALNLRATGIEGQAALEGLTGLDNLETLELSRNNLPNGVNLGQFPALKTLKMEDSKVAGTAWLSQDACALTSLDLSSNTLDDFAGIAACEQLQTLALNSTKMEDGDVAAAGIPAKAQLATLHVSQNALTQVDFAPAIASLTELKANDNQVTVVDSLATAKGLQVIEMNNNKVASLEPLKPLPALTAISFATNPVMKWSDTYLVRCPVKDTASKTLADYCERHLGKHYSFLWHCLFVTDPKDARHEAVRRVMKEIEVPADQCVAGYLKMRTEPKKNWNLSKTRNSDIKNIAALHDNVFATAKTINLSGNSVKNLRPLAVWTGLTKLNAVGTKARAMPKLRRMRNLKHLWLADTQFSKLDFLTKAGNKHPLETLFINGENLKSYAGVETLPNLQNLQLGPSPLIAELGVVATMTHLRSLNILGNRQFSPLDLSDFENLRYLGVVDQSADPEYLSKMELPRKLLHLDARFNVETTASYQALPTRLPELNSLNIFGNPDITSVALSEKPKGRRWQNLTKFCANVPTPKTATNCPTTSGVIGIDAFCSGDPKGKLPGCKKKKTNKDEAFDLSAPYKRYLAGEFDWAGFDD